MSLAGDPVAYTLVVLGVAAIGGLVAAGLWAVRQRGRATPSRLPARTALARAASYAGLAALLGVAVAIGTAGIALLVALIGALALVEWARLADLPRHHAVALQVANVVIVAVVCILGPSGTDILVGGIVLVGIAWPVLLPDPGRAMRDLGFAAVGCAVISGSLVHAVAMSADYGADGAVLFAALAISVACSDVGAYLVGRRFGRTPLAPRLSPNKTRAGVVGNLLGALVGVIVFVPVLEPALGAAYMVLLVPVVGLGAVWGDLLESAAKREAGVKDAGDWLPGFGGILDRIDSLLVVLPLAYWTLRLVGALGAAPTAVTSFASNA